MVIMQINCHLGNPGSVLAEREIERENVYINHWQQSGSVGQATYFVGD